jgi:hypothetical protein
MTASAFAIMLMIAPVIMAPVHANTLVPASVDCPGINAITSATSGNDGSSISVSQTFVGNTVHHLISLPTNVELIEECVYPNGGDLSTVSSMSTSVTDWTAELNCKGAGGVNTCVHAIRNHGYSNIVGPTTNTDDLEITYTTVTGLTWIKALHVLDNVPNDQGPCHATGQTCFVFPTGHVFPPPGGSTLTTAVVDEGPGYFLAGDSFHDTATLTVSGDGGATPTGTVTYSFYATGTCSGKPVWTQTVAVAGDGSVPNSQSTGPITTPGDYSFQATYSGMSSVYPSATSNCEPFTVSPIPSVPQFSLGVSSAVLAALILPVLLLMSRTRRVKVQ